MTTAAEIEHLQKHGLYSGADEHDACGVGFVAHIKGEKSHAIVQQTTVENWQDSFRSMNLFGPQDPIDAFFGAVLLYDTHLVDVTDESLFSNAVMIVDSELSGVAPQTPVVLIGLGRPTA